ncbi:hypothetical protein BO79DRAFT_228710 [Aspergillus costaricaensis CBS 115574]|uniref:Uncharacterized protein n=1 Tax=Aspergillus costaricaensis CBS 115574 TaxID=1448317 RepID=A0ACD1IDL7_9EURO|nr:hypothetical protein BO79DRAFT_228710 [Aspergillus costaricaensis CBS 115574]RAK88687.1 hypothetical protein BO79DRAFT_228710 [Aspergillus costaricaensis CBS 115574]
MGVGPTIYVLRLYRGVVSLAWIVDAVQRLGESRDEQKGDLLRGLLIVVLRSSTLVWVLWFGLRLWLCRDRLGLFDRFVCLNGGPPGVTILCEGDQNLALSKNVDLRKGRSVSVRERSKEGRRRGPPISRSDRRKQWTMGDLLLCQRDTTGYWRDACLVFKTTTARIINRCGSSEAPARGNSINPMIGHLELKSSRHSMSPADWSPALLATVDW